MIPNVEYHLVKIGSRNGTIMVITLGYERSPGIVDKESLIIHVNQSAIQKLTRHEIKNDAYLSAIGIAEQLQKEI